jgi:hypothetical protein
LEREKIMRTMKRMGIAVALCLVTSPLGAETVQVRYRGPVDLGPFDCTDVTRSSFIHRVCFARHVSFGDLTV